MGIRKWKIENFTKEELWEMVNIECLALWSISGTLIDLSKGGMNQKEAIEKIRDRLEDYDSEMEKYKYE